MGSSLFVDPQMIPVLEAMKENMASREGMQDLSSQEIRDRAAVDLSVWNRNPPVLARVEDLEIPGPYGLTKVRIYDSAPDLTTQRPLLVYFHGGGWIIGDLDTEDQSLRQLALASECAIVSVDYVLAPENKFPAPVVDCCSAVRWISQNGQELGLDTARMAIGGASAGANLAMATALSLRDSGELTAQFLLFFYGVFSGSLNSQTYDEFGNGDFGLSRDAMDFFLSSYLSKKEDRDHPWVSPLHADLAGLPPVYLSVAGLDPLRDDNRALAERLKMANVPTEIKEYEGVVHGFTLMGSKLDAANVAIEDAGAALMAGLK
ncbi:MAG: alpha/beta hydrolase [Kordiimonadaceae bacterium]|nr:alpha/beta hydrolase [Kordiimonadaceae bacterium]